MWACKESRQELTRKQAKNRRSVKRVVLQASENFLSAVSRDGRWLSLGEGRRAAPQHWEELRNKCGASGARTIERVKFITALPHRGAWSSLDRANGRLRLAVINIFRPNDRSEPSTYDWLFYRILSGSVSIEISTCQAYYCADQFSWWLWGSTVQEWSSLASNVHFL